jgi:DNA-binding MarR family transcriptional regulator
VLTKIPPSVSQLIASRLEFRDLTCVWQTSHSITQTCGLKLATLSRRIKRLFFRRTVRRRSLSMFNTITKYATDSPRDFKELGLKVTQRLEAILKTTQELGAVSKLSPTQETEGLTPHEVAALIILMENRISPDATLTASDIKERMRRSGFTDIAVSIGLSSLSEKGYLEYRTDSDDFGNTWATCAITSKGLKRIRDNQGFLVLKIRDPEPPSDEDIPPSFVESIMMPRPRRSAAGRTSTAATILAGSHVRWSRDRPLDFARQGSRRWSGPTARTR